MQILDRVNLLLDDLLSEAPKSIRKYLQQAKVYLRRSDYFAAYGEVFLAFHKCKDKKLCFKLYDLKSLMYGLLL